VEGLAWKNPSGYPTGMVDVVIYEIITSLVNLFQALQPSHFLPQQEPRIPWKSYEND
jgi:hypothetical protein